MNLDQQVECIREALRRINRAAGVLKQDPYGIGLSLSQAHALLDLHRLGSLRSHDLVTNLKLDKSTVSRLVADLVDEGLIKMQPDPEDGRAKRLVLTATGRKLVQVIMAKSNNTALSCFKHLGSNERDDVVDAFMKAANALEVVD